MIIQPKTSDIFRSFYLLMTFTQGAKEIKTKPTQLSTWIARGQLPAYDDPTETNPRRRRRVLL
jgi:hypothetical protein